MIVPTDDVAGYYVCLFGGRIAQTSEVGCQAATPNSEDDYSPWTLGAWRAKMTTPEAHIEVPTTSIRL